MNTHLTPQLIVDAVDGTVESAARAHLSACEACRTEVERVRAILQEAESAAPVQEPSPLFWDHFADRVRQATSAIPVTQKPIWGERWWRPAAVVGAAAAVIMFVVMMQRALPPAPAVEQVVVDADATTPVDVDEWELIVGLTDDLGWDEVQQVTRPRRGVADAMIDELSPEERAAFVKLLKQEMGGLE